MTRDFNDQYYIILKNYSEVTLHLTALQKSADRDYEFEQLVWGKEPLFFENAYRDKDNANGVIRPIPSVLLDATIPIVSSKIRERLKLFNFVGMQLYPAVYIDDGGNYHEDYWCMNFW
nr:hypothetical protein [Pseudoalteromonas sp. GCY]